MAGENLNLRTVIETVLDSKGFEDFKAKIQQAGNAAENAGKGATESGASFERLGHRLPHASFHLLSYEMLENAGIHGHIRPLIALSSTAMDSLAASTGFMSNAMVGATLGLSLLIPLVLSMRKGTEESGKAVKDWTADGNDLLKLLEELKTKTGHLTGANKELYEALKQSRDIQAEQELDQLNKKIEENVALLKKRTDLTNVWNLVQHNTRDMLKGHVEAQKEDMETKHELAIEIEKLQAQEKYWQSVLDGTRHKLEDDVKAADKAAEARKKLAEETQQAAKNEAAYQAAADKERLDNQAALAKAMEGGRNEDFLRFLQGEEKKRKEAEQSAKAFVAAEADANRAIARNDVASARTLHQHQLAARREFQLELNEKVRAYREAGLDEVAIARYVASEEQRFAEEQAKQDAQAANDKMQMEAMILANTGALIEAAFGKSKAARYASTVVNTAAAVMEALASAPPPASYVMAAYAAAMGAVQLAKIQGTDAGFDDPLNDALMTSAFRNFGRRWAADAANLATSAAAQGFGDGVRRFGASQNMGSVVHQTTKIDRGTHIGNLTFNGAYFTPRQAMLEMERRRIRIERIENRTRRR